MITPEQFLPPVSDDSAYEQIEQHIDKCITEAKGSLPVMVYKSSNNWSYGQIAHVLDKYRKAGWNVSTGSYYMCELSITGRG